MAQNRDITVIVPCYNHTNVLRRTLEALVRQTQPAKEVVVIDDASKDDPKPIVDSFKDRLPISYLRLRENHGAPRARNEGAALASSMYLLFLDADAELVPQALEKYVAALEAHPEADFAYANFYWGWKIFHGGPFDAEALKKGNWIHTSSLLRRSAFPGFDESLKKFQDWDLWLTLAERGSRGIWIDEPLFRVEPRRAGEGMSRWMPRFVHAMPWPILGWMPEEIRNHREKEEIIRKKHAL